MKRGYLSQYFAGFAAKRLSIVEVSSSSSNQHEFNGVKKLRLILGEPTEKVRYNAKFIFLNDNQEEYPVEDGFLTWYDARERHPSRSEYRLYFSGTHLLELASPGDLLFILRSHSNELVCLIIRNGTTIENQIEWLFDYTSENSSEFTVRDQLEAEHDKIDYISKFILTQIGIEYDDHDGDNYLELMLIKFRNRFPLTSIFSEFSRSTLPYIHSVDNPDEALIKWMEREESLFKSLEKHLLSEKLKRGFGDDMANEFLKLSLSVQNRRKSRAGFAFENHLECIFKQNKIPYSRSKITENNHKPDFIFPSIKKYHDPLYPSLELIMLAAKTSCKERWRQILNEAERIEKKHLLTLEPGITVNSTNEMCRENVQLILPKEIHKTYTDLQRSYIITLADFVNHVKKTNKIKGF